MSSLKNQVAIITGASKGIGAAIARSLAASGVHLMLVARSTDKLTTLQAELNKAFPASKVLIETADVRDAKRASEITLKTIAELGQIDILVNNAGIAPKQALFQEASIEAIDNTIDTNLKAPMYWMHAVLPHLISRQTGTIININSVAGKTAYPYWSIYDASKFGLTALTEAVAEEQRSNGIRVVGIHPGAVDTDIWDSVDLDGKPSYEGMLRDNDIANAVLYTLQQPQRVFVNEITLTPLKPVL